MRKRLWNRGITGLADLSELNARFAELEAERNQLQMYVSRLENAQGLVVELAKEGQKEITHATG